jgi:DNA polymerase-3 subunit alpha
MRPEDYARLGEQVVPEAICLIRGKVDRRSREPNLVVNQLYTLDQADKEFTSQLAIKFQCGLHTEEDMLRTRDVLQRFPGSTEVVVVVDTLQNEDSGDRVRVILTTPQNMRVSVGTELKAELDRVLGGAHFELKSTKPSRRQPVGAL